MYQWTFQKFARASPRKFAMLIMIVFEMVSCQLGPDVSLKYHTVLFGCGSEILFEMFVYAPIH